MSRFAILNVPHPNVFKSTLRSDLDQLRRSWYIMLFQLPLLGEWLLGAGDCRSVRAMLEGEGVAEAVIVRYLAAFRASGWAGPINYYRSSFWGGWDKLDTAIDQACLVLWGERDAYLKASMALPPRSLVPNARLVLLPDAGHWVHWNAVDKVNAELLAFLG